MPAGSDPQTATISYCQSPTGHSRLPFQQDEVVVLHRPGKVGSTAPALMPIHKR